MSELATPVGATTGRLIVIPWDVDGTPAKRGHVGCFVEVPAGAKVRHTDMPLLVELAANDFRFVACTAIAGLPASTKVLAVCTHLTSRPSAMPLWDDVLEARASATATEGQDA